MKGLAKTMIWIGAIALVIGVIGSLTGSMGHSMPMVIRSINWWRGSIALFAFAIALLLSEK
ncbi:MAG TPA: hypothetical protein VMD02_04155 [Candidatus Omnitrophota bacterium]|nr:hypothetical protein [Candidatus Omnitrophota bacterium]